MKKLLSIAAISLVLGLFSVEASILATGEAHSAIIRGDQSIWTWGNNDYGQTGQGSVASPAAPTQLNIGGFSFKHVACGSHHTVAINTLGNLFAWGHNAYGQLGLGDTNNSNVPMALPAAGNLSEASVAVAAGDYSTYVLKLSGELYAFGRNQEGQLGLGYSSSFESTPMQVPFSQKISKISAGPDFAVAISENGQLFAWGSNGFGQLGLGNFDSTNAPMTIGSDHDWVDVSCGGSHVLALKSNGDLYAWGNDNFGQTGIGSQNIPGLVTTGVTSISAGREHSLVIENSVQLWTQGRSQVGQSGQGMSNNGSMSLGQVGTNEWFTAITGRYHNLALKNDGQLYAWGLNRNGQADTVNEIENVPQAISLSADPVPMVQIQPVGNITSGENINLNASVAGAGTTTWQITHGPAGSQGDISGTSTTASFNPSLPGTYIVRIEVDNGSDIGVQTYAIHVQAAVFGKMIWGTHSWNQGPVAPQTL